MCNLPLKLNGDVLAVYVSAYGSLQETTPIRSADGTAQRDYVFNICHDREGFQAVLNVLTCKDQHMTVVVEGRKTLCGSYKKIGHMARACPLKTPSNSNNTNNNNNNEKKKTLVLPPIPSWKLVTNETTLKKKGPRLPGRRNFQRKLQ